jgi:hypothetical protein
MLRVCGYVAEIAHIVIAFQTGDTENPTMMKKKEEHVCHVLHRGRLDWLNRNFGPRYIFLGTDRPPYGRLQDYFIRLSMHSHFPQHTYR